MPEGKSMSTGMIGPKPAVRGRSLRILLAGAKGCSCLLVALAFAACGSNQALLTARLRTEAEELQAACRRTALSTPETKQADEHLASAVRNEKEGEDGIARREADLAVVLYRLALVRRDETQARASVYALKAALAKDRDQLQTYQQVLEEVKTKRTP
jgi:hypothetical protein